MIMYCVRESCSRSGERKVLIDLQVVYSQYTVHVFISQVRLYPQYGTCIYFTSKIVWLYDLECVLDCTKDMRVHSVYGTLRILYGCIYLTSGKI